MESEQQSVFHEIESELHVLRASVIAQDVAGVERHTAATADLLRRLQPMLEGGRANAPRAEVRALSSSVRKTLVMVLKARRTVQALVGVYQLFVDGEHRASLEMR